MLPLYVLCFTYAPMSLLVSPDKENVRVLQQRHFYRMLTSCPTAFFSSPSHPSSLPFRSLHFLNCSSSSSSSSELYMFTHTCLTYFAYSFHLALPVSFAFIRSLFSFLLPLLSSSSFCITFILLFSLPSFFFSPPFTQGSVPCVAYFASGV